MLVQRMTIFADLFDHYHKPLILHPQPRILAGTDIHEAKQSMNHARGRTIDPAPPNRVISILKKICLRVRICLRVTKHTPTNHRAHHRLPLPATGLLCPEHRVLRLPKRHYLTVLIPRS